MSLRPKMVGWFDPPQPVAIAIRVAISTVFGELADRRKILAAAPPDCSIASRNCPEVLP
jgi:hypothetical protein